MRHEMDFEERFGTAEHGRIAWRHGDSHEVRVCRQVLQLPAIGTPPGITAAFERDRMSRAWYRETPNFDFEPSGAVRRISHPFSVLRQPRLEILGAVLHALKASAGDLRLFTLIYAG
jgi:hypothetical protein